MSFIVHRPNVDNVLQKLAHVFNTCFPEQAVKLCHIPFKEMKIGSIHKLFDSKDYAEFAVTADEHVASMFNVPPKDDIMDICYKEAFTMTFGELANTFFGRYNQIH